MFLLTLPTATQLSGSGPVQLLSSLLHIYWAPALCKALLGPTDCLIKDSPNIQIVWKPSDFCPQTICHRSFLFPSVSTGEVRWGCGFFTGWHVPPRAWQMGSGTLLAPALSWHCRMSSAHPRGFQACLYMPQTAGVFFPPETLNLRVS